MSSESNFSYTTKVGSDLLTVRGDTFDAFLANAVSLASVPAVQHLLDVLDGRMVSLDTAVANVTAALGASPVVASFDYPFAPVAPPVAAPAVAGDRTCQHGVMVKRTGMGQKGEWRAWFCPTPKGTPDQCQAKFADRKNPLEWNAF